MNDKKFEFRRTLRDRSMILVLPREEFKAWVTEMSIHDPTAAPYRPICPFEETSSWLIPESGRFKSHVEFNNYLEDLKPSLLAMEIRSVYKGTENFRDPITKEIFDKFFEMKVINTIVEIDELFGK